MEKDALNNRFAGEFAAAECKFFVVFQNFILVPEPEVDDIHVRLDMGKILFIQFMHIDHAVHLELRIVFFQRFGAGFKTFRQDDFQVICRYIVAHCTDDIRELKR